MNDSPEPHDSHVDEWLERTLFVPWCDATLNADHWIGLDVVSPEHAAMLLCRLNPDEESIGSAERAASDCTSGEDFKKLRRLFKDASQSDPRRRTLVDWLGVAKDKGAKHHPWLERYQGLTAELATTTKPSTPEAVAGQRVKLPTVQEAIAEFVDQAMCKNPGWTAERLHGHFRQTAGGDGSPFSRLTASGELFCVEAEKACGEASAKAALTAWRKRRRLAATKSP